MRGWYKTSTNRLPHPAHVMLYQINADQMKLYRHAPYPVDSIPVNTYPLTIDESIPTMEEVKWKVQRLW